MQVTIPPVKPTFVYFRISQDLREKESTLRTLKLLRDPRYPRIPALLVKRDADFTLHSLQV